MRWTLLVLWALVGNVAGCKRDDGSPPSVGATEAAYQAEIAFLREQLQRGTPRASDYTIINAHEHLMAPRFLPPYLAAARRQGIVRTVVVTSPAFTMYGEGDKSYVSMAENWAELVAAEKAYPGEIIPFAAVDPHDPDKLAHLEAMVAEGARGVKLYSGHSNLYDLPLDDPSMEPVYTYIEAQGLPLNWHVNVTKYGAELERVLSRHPKLNVMIPHYGVVFWSTSESLPALAALLRKHPNVYVDTSLGTRDILVNGMFVMAAHEAAFRSFFDEFQDRIVYGSDAVITGNPEKTTSWFFLVIGATRDHLEAPTFVFPLAEAYARYFDAKRPGHNPDGRVKGLALAPAILKKVYEQNPKTWLEKHRPLAPLPPR